MLDDKLPGNLVHLLESSHPGALPRYAQAFIDESAEAVGKSLTLSAGALRHLERQDWPGNIRELRNMMERIVAMSKREHLSLGYVKSLLQNSFSSPDGESSGAMRTRKEQQLRDALAACEGNLEKTARSLGVSRVTLWRHMSAFSINRKEYTHE